MLEVMDTAEPLQREAWKPSLLARERDRAERRLNAVRGAVLVLLAIAAATYAHALPPALNRVNMAVLVPMMAWTAAQYALLYRRDMLPQWLSNVNPACDIVAVTVTMLGYGLAGAPALALKSPMVLAYFPILAARPISSSTRGAAVISGLVVLAYAALELFFASTRGVVLVQDPLLASSGAGIALLDEGAKLVLLAVAGGVATYTTFWYEQLSRRYSREATEREILHSRLASSRLDTLKQQLQPHFLFNALNAISALVDSDPPGAQTMISGLGELIRVSLDGGGAQEVPLSRELTVLAHYVAIQQIRFEDRLKVSMFVDEQVRSALVPALILQPLVENSIQHGIAQFSAPARIEIHARREGEYLVLDVLDDGCGVAAGKNEIVERVGIGQARARLMYLYGDEHSFTIERPEAGGFAVRMRIPYHTGRRTTPASGRAERMERAG